MCVRCGTGRIAWCTDPTRHEAILPDDEDPRPTGNYEVQAWKCTGPNFNGYVYTQLIAIDKFADGCDITMVWLPRNHQPAYGTWRLRS
jgi:hypothetical protein